MGIDRLAEISRRVNQGLERIGARVGSLYDERGRERARAVAEWCSDHKRPLLITGVMLSSGAFVRVYNDVTIQNMLRSNPDLDVSNMQTWSLVATTAAVIVIGVIASCMPSRQRDLSTS